jgi:hypothetical protein
MIELKERYEIDNYYLFSAYCSGGGNCDYCTLTKYCVVRCNIRFEMVIIDE